MRAARNGATAVERVARYRARVLESTSAREIAREIERTESDPEGVGIMTRKGRVFLVRLDDVPLKASPLLKQEMLAVGADAAHARGVADLTVERSAVVLLGTWVQYQRTIPKLRRQPFRLREIAEAIDGALRHYTARAKRVVRGLHRSFTVGERTRVMGVLNVTPDSFSDGGRFFSKEAAVARARELLAEGADLIDIGGESTRPGAGPVSAPEQLRRILGVLEPLHEFSAVPLSVDTRSPEVARAALEAGADLVNDVSGLRDPEMRKVVARSGAPAILMHMRGTPETMQSDLEYADLRDEVYGELAQRAMVALADGIAADRLLIDPGLGFGKSADQSLELLAHIGEFRSLGFPVVVGASRKSFLSSTLGGAPVGERLEASLAAAVVAALRGAHVVRAHDVGPTVRAVKLADALRGADDSAEADVRSSSRPE